MYTCYKYEKDEVDRNLSCKCTVLCYILEYIYILQITKRRISHVLAFNMQIADQVEFLFFFLHFESKHKNWVSLCYFVQCLYIFQFVTEISTFSRQNKLYFVILVLITMYTLVLGVHVCHKVIEMNGIQQAQLAQSVEHQTSNFRVVGSSPTVGKNFSFVFCRFRPAPDMSTGPMQMKSSMTSIRGINVYRCKERMTI